MEIESGNGRFNVMFWFKKLTYFVRCFPHIINIAVKTGLKYATTIPIDDAEVMPEDISEIFEGTSCHDDWQYREALQGDVIGALRKLVNAVRASGQRRDDLEDAIKSGNTAGSFTLNVLVLLRDVDTRWSSIFNMVDRGFYLYPVSYLLC